MKKQSFTLLELILVIGIAAILTVMAGPIYRTIFAGNNSQRAATELTARIAYARNYSVVNHTYTALIFLSVDEDTGLIEGLHTDVSTSDKKELKKLSGNYYNAAYRLAVVSRSEGGFKFRMWVPDSKWNFLPSEIIIPPGEKYFGVQESNEEFEDDDEEEINEDFYTVDEDIDLIEVKDVNLVELLNLAQYKEQASQEGGTVSTIEPDDSDSDRVLADIKRCLIFRPNGQLASSANKSVLIHFAAATYDPSMLGEPGFRFIPKDRSEDGTVEYVMLVLNPLTGKVKYHHKNDKPEFQEE